MLLRLLTTLTLILLVAGTSSGQPAPSQPAQDDYASVLYLQVEPGSQSALEEIGRTTLRQLYTELLKEPGTNFRGWSFARVLYRGLDDDAPTHLSVMYFSGPPPGGDSDQRYQAALKKVTGAGYAEFPKKLASLRRIVGTELARGIAWAGSVPEGSYRVTYHGKAAPMKLDAVEDHFTRVWKPIYDAAVKEGDVLSYTAARTVFPRGEGVHHDLIFTLTFKDLPSAVKGYSVTPATFARFHPNASYIGASDATRELRTIRKTFLTRVLFRVAAPQQE